MLTEYNFQDLNKKLQEIKLILYSLEDKVKRRDLLGISEYIVSLVKNVEEFCTKLQSLDVSIAHTLPVIKETKERIDNIVKNLKTKEQKIINIEEILKEFFSYLVSKGLKKASANIYCRVLKKYLNKLSLTRTDIKHLPVVLEHFREFCRIKGLNFNI